MNIKEQVQVNCPFYGTDEFHGNCLAFFQYPNEIKLIGRICESGKYRMKACQDAALDLPYEPVPHDPADSDTFSVGVTERRVGKKDRRIHEQPHPPYYYESDRRESLGRRRGDW